MAAPTIELDYYSVVGVASTADSNEITSAYRKASLKVHPDRNPDDPLAAEKFHALKTAFDVLLDPIKRAEFDAKRAAQAARAARFAGLGNKRKALARDLEAREEAYTKQQTESSNQIAKMKKLEEIKAAGLRMRQAKEAELSARPVPSETAAPIPTVPSSSTVPNVQAPHDTLDCTLRFKWSKKKIPDLTTADALSARIVSSAIISAGDIESIVVSSKTVSASADKPEGASKKGSAMVSFKSLALCDRFYEFAQTDASWTNCSITRLNER